jgi:signal transduction histidine kinase
MVILVGSNDTYSQQTEKTLKTKNILVLFSLEPGTPVYDNIIENFKSHIRKNYPNPMSFCIDYVQFSRFNDDKHLAEFFEHFNNKYEDSKFDLFVTIGPNLNPLIDKYGCPFADLVPRVSLDFCYPPLYHNDYLIRKNETFINIDFDFEKNVQGALNILPDTKNIFLVAGCSAFDMRMLKNYTLATDKLANKYNVTIYSGLPLNILQKKLSTLPENSVVFLPSYQLDSLGATYYGAEICRLVANYTSAPIFTLFDVAMNNNIGGALISASTIGEKISETSIRILNGEKPESIPQYHSDFNKFIFEWKELKKWNVNEKNLPEGCIVVNREYSFFEEYIGFIIAVIIFVVIETLLLIYLFYLNAKQKKQAAIILKHENRYKELVDFNRLSELSEITASLSHQLNQPLTAILSSSQASLRFLKNDKFEKLLFEEIMNNIVEDVKRASAIIISLRSMMKKEIREKKRENINKIAFDVYSLFDSQASINDIHVDTQFDESVPFVSADSTLIQQVILNLLLNAAESLEEKEGNKNILLTTKVQDDYVTISVADNGKGIDKSLEDDIFKPFFTTKSKGLGIGLAICKTIVEDHEGKLHFANNETGGAIFSFKLRVIK